MTNSPSKTFGERLIEALEYQGITDHQQQVEKVAQACHVTARTARKYLSSTNTQCSIRFRNALRDLANALECDVRWLFNGDGCRRWTEFINMMSLLSDYHQSKIVRFMLRSINNDPKAERLCALRNSGQITVQQWFAAM